MPTGRFVTKNVPDERLPRVVGDFLSEGAHVTTLPEPDGEWTVIAVFPDVPESTTADTPSAGGDG